MKIIGKNSASTYISYFLKVISILFLLEFIYTLIGYSFLFYQFKTGNSIPSDFFLLGKDVGWSKNQWTAPMDDFLKFKIYIPFTSQNLITGIFDIDTILKNIINGLFICLFLFSSYKIFKGIAAENVFNRNAIIWLKRFGWLNIGFTIIVIALSSLTAAKHIFAISYSSIPYLFFGILILFMVEFFKKGHELQSENDLTI